MQIERETNVQPIFPAGLEPETLRLHSIFLRSLGYLPTPSILTLLLLLIIYYFAFWHFWLPAVGNNEPVQFQFY